MEETERLTTFEDNRNQKRAYASHRERTIAAGLLESWK